ncbi:GNAT family N-acetyltransferase [Microvirga aerilata]|uniref:GNAT family N-acetyltransferase n=1 Tax=Microvirga aerilata TaxID=670292 RepID=A0A936Z921_9HYPH|nr:GNAT family N-acetyltransferase [Microvirga aerilata]MBL0406668.1 GNAT family N-acetyltransferase [Microvirga aerilata]
MSNSTSITIMLEEDPNGTFADEVERELLAALRQNTPPGDGKSLTLVARDFQGSMVGGLVGSTSYGWLLVKMLWVAEALRGQGLGARLMTEAETIARSRGCHGAWLDTSSARAERFYIRFGYEPFGVLMNRPGEQPPGHRRAFLSKRLIEEFPDELGTFLEQPSANIPLQECGSS